MRTCPHEVVIGVGFCTTCDRCHMSLPMSYLDELQALTPALLDLLAEDESETST